MSYFTQYEPYILQASNQYGVPPSILNGLFSQESGFNPFAVGDNGAAYGMGQLHAGAASDVGVNRFDPIQNIFGSAHYLSNMFSKFGNWTDALAAYNQGTGGIAKGLNYANSVLSKAKSFGADVASFAKTATSVAACATGDPLACASAAGSMGSGLGISVPSDWVQEIKDWIGSTSFFQRIALALVALLFILGALYTLKGK